MKLNIASVRNRLGRARRNFTRRPDARWGQDFISEVQTRIDCEVKTIFDVGAHIGLTAIEFSDRFPSATVYAFEPSSSSMSRLNANLLGKPRVQRCQFAFGHERGTAELLVEPDHPSMARINSMKTAGVTERIEVSTIDAYCREQRVKSIDILKIDTEGFEIQVLKGAQEMLQSSAISIIKLETAIDPDDTYHTQLFDVCSILHPLGYRIFGIYDQWEDTLKPTPRIRRFDVVFISELIYKK